MADFLDAYSIQYWLESAPQGYLVDTEYGHPTGEKEAALVLEDPLIHEQAIRTTVQLVVGERVVALELDGLDPDPRALDNPEEEDARLIQLRFVHGDRCQVMPALAVQHQDVTRRDAGVLTEVGEDHVPLAENLYVVPG